MTASRTAVGNDERVELLQLTFVNIIQLIHLPGSLFVSLLQQYRVAHELQHLQQA
jgi:hypothetical protein